MGRKSTNVPPVEMTATGYTGAAVALAKIARAVRERPSAPRKTAGRKNAAAGSAVPAGENTSISNLSDAVDPNREEVAQLAYSYWEARGCAGGSPEQDWFRAEQEIRERTAAERTS